MPLFSKLFTNKPDKSAGAVSRYQSVIRIFQQLFKDRAPVTVIFEGYPELQFITMILAVDKKNDYYVLDELTPAKGNELMQQKLKFFATTSDHGITVKFKGRMGGLDVDKNTTYYKVKIPRKIDYQQRRNAFRVPIAFRTNTTVRFKVKGQEYLGVVSDMSITGLRLKYEGDLTNVLIENKEIKPVILAIPEENSTLKVTLELRYVAHDEDNDATIVGAKFVDLDKEHFALINKFLGAQQRELRRKEANSNDKED